MAPPPLFFQTPLRYLRYASREHPAIYWSIVIGGLSPVIMVTVPWARRAYLGPEGAADPLIPMTYPIPSRARRVVPAGFEDE